MSPPSNPQLKTQGERNSPLQKLKTQDIALVVACAIFAILTIYQLNLPGLYADEALDVVPAMQLLNQQPIDFGAVRGAYFPLGGLKLPLMNSDYQGVVGTYGVLPFIAFGGVNVYSIRLFTIVTGIIAMMLAYYWGRALLGANVAAIAVLLLAFSPSWVFWSRIGIYVVAQVVPITIGALYCLFRWWRGGRGGTDRWLVAGAFLIGLGFSTKFLFLWLPLALLVSYGLFSAPRIRALGWSAGLRGMGEAGPPRRFIRNTLVSLAAFVIGAFPIVWYNLTTRGTYHVLIDNLLHTSKGVNNADLLHNLHQVVGDFQVLLDGSFFWFQAYGGQPYHNPFYPLAYLAALTLLLGGVVFAGRNAPPPAPPGGRGDHALPDDMGGLERDEPDSLPHLGGGLGWGFVAEIALLAGALGFFLAWWYAGAEAIIFELVFFVCFGLLLGRLAIVPRRNWYHRPIVFLTLISALIVAMSAVTVSEILPTHLLLLLPAPQLTIAAALVVLANALRGYLAHRTAPRASAIVAAGVAVALVFALLLSDFLVDSAYHRDLAKQGGYITFSDAIYTLNDYLLQRGATQPVLMDWGFQYNLQVLSDGKLNPLAIFQYTPAPDAAFYNALDVTLKNPANLYIFHIPEAAAGYPGRYPAFMAETKKLGLTPHLERTFYHRDGLPVYEVWSAR
jgi:Dolichyl-phosphate-mannose-protein mannosyltransferase